MGVAKGHGAGFSQDTPPVVPVCLCPGFTVDSVDPWHVLPLGLPEKHLFHSSKEKGRGVP